jgi:hypothetical protein
MVARLRKKSWTQPDAQNNAFAPRLARYVRALVMRLLSLTRNKRTARDMAMARTIQAIPFYSVLRLKEAARNYFQKTDVELKAYGQMLTTICSNGGKIE